MGSDSVTTSFSGLVNLADEGLGARALACSDDFFAPMHCMLRPGRGEFDPNAYTDRGKLMDGWESRRRRTPGHDWCIVQLGIRGAIRILDIDTNHFLGNHPPYASVEALHTSGNPSNDELADADWIEILPQVPLRAGSQNIFPVREQRDWPRSWTHLRLNMFPDGGIARFRVHGDVDPDWRPAVESADEETRGRLKPDEVDLVSVRNGGMAVAASDMFFGPMYNLILPGRAVNMGGGWETRRKRGPGFDWLVLKLGAPGSIGLIEVDTNHFKGNAPRACSLEGLLAPEARLTDLADPGNTRWQPILPESELQPHTRHFFRDAGVPAGPFSHVRLNIFPDGGVSRLRLYGTRAEVQ